MIKLGKKEFIEQVQLNEIQIINCKSVFYIFPNFNEVNLLIKFS